MKEYTRAEQKNFAETLAALPWKSVLIRGSRSGRLWDNSERRFNVLQPITAAVAVAVTGVLAGFATPVIPMVIAPTTVTFMLWFTWLRIPEVETHRVSLSIAFIHRSLWMANDNQTFLKRRATRKSLRQALKNAIEAQRIGDILRPRFSNTRLVTPAEVIFKSSLEHYSSLLTTLAPGIPELHAGDAVKISHGGNGAFLLETGERSVTIHISRLYDADIRTSCCGGGALENSRGLLCAICSKPLHWGLYSALGKVGAVGECVQALSAYLALDRLSTVMVTMDLEKAWTDIHLDENFTTLERELEEMRGEAK